MNVKWIGFVSAAAAVIPFDRRLDCRLVYNFRWQGISF